MKSYTDIDQSKKLAEILPLESADMHYNNISIKGINYADEHRAEPMEYNRAIKILSKYTINPLFKIIPCWSLAALLDFIQKPDLVQNSEGIWLLHSWVKAYPWSVGGYSNPVDACYEMIIKLHELDLV